MAGKIFPESNNIYQDQAKILFNYYSQAAEKIVQEEERIEHEIAVLEEEKVAGKTKGKDDQRIGAGNERGSSYFRFRKSGATKRYLV